MKNKNNIKKSQLEVLRNILGRWTKRKLLQNVCINKKIHMKSEKVENEEIVPTKSDRLLNIS